MVDIDYEKITMFAGNYDFWVKSSELIKKQMTESNKRKEEKIKEFEDLVRMLLSQNKQHLERNH